MIFEKLRFLEQCPSSSFASHCQAIDVYVLPLLTSESKFAWIHELFKSHWTRTRPRLLSWGTVQQSSLLIICLKMEKINPLERLLAYNE